MPIRKERVRVSKTMQTSKGRDDGGVDKCGLDMVIGEWVKETGRDDGGIAEWGGSIRSSRTVIAFSLRTSLLRA